MLQIRIVRGAHSVPRRLPEEWPRRRRGGGRHRNHKEGRMATRNCGAAGALGAEKDYPRKVSRAAGLRLRAGLALAPFFLLCATASSSLLAAPQQSNGSSLQEQNASSKEVDQLRKEVNELREDLKRLHALLESHAGAPETAITPAPQPTAAVQPAVPPTGVVTQVARHAPA